eukprot:6182647-Pleurochrysis_carterae.AAC.2
MGGQTPALGMECVSSRCSSLECSAEHEADKTTSTTSLNILKGTPGQSPAPIPLLPKPHLLFFGLNNWQGQLEDRES